MTRRNDDEVPSVERALLDDKTEDLLVLQRWVVIVTGVAASPDTLIFAEPIIVGSDSGCEIVIDHATVLPRHLRLVPSEKCVIVEDASGGVDTKRAGAELLAGQEHTVGAATLYIKRTF